MTREEAIIHIGTLRTVTKDIPKYSGKAIDEAVDMAIKALEQEPFKPMVEIDLYSVIKQKYIEREVLEKIRAEIEDAAKKFNMRPEISYDTAYSDGLYGALSIIDKYRAESEKV